jgi:RNA polymerase sigma factor (sigma-70 family)
VEASAFTHSHALPGLRGPSPLLRLQSDEKLIALTRRGTHAAFEVICSRYQSRLLAFCRHMLSSREDAEDVLQEVFAAAFNAVLADERPINVRPWLYRIARNRSLNHLRRATAIGVDSMDVHFADHGISTSDRALKRESFRELLADVGQLPETQRTALLLREIDALSYDQIAHAMDTTVPSVKSLLVRARISLAESAEARKLSCDEVRLELGHVAEGLGKMSAPIRRHVRDCDRCRFFKKQLRENNHALAAMLPVGPLLLLKKLLLAKLGTTASAGSAQVAGGASAGVGAGIGAGAIAGLTGGGAGGAFTIGAGAIASKAVAGLAAAAIVGAGAVAADDLTVRHNSRHHVASAAVASAGAEPVVIGQRSQPITASRRAAVLGHRAHHARQLAKASDGAAVTTTPVATSTAPAVDPASSGTPAPPPPTQVTSETTTLPPQATAPPPSGEPTATGEAPAPPPPAPTGEATGTTTATVPAPSGESSTTTGTTTTATAPAPTTTTAPETVVQPEATTSTATQQVVAQRPSSRPRRSANSTRRTHRSARRHAHR